MKMNEPIGNALYGPLLIRLALGSYFVMAGLAKMHNIPAFVQEVQNFNVLPPQLSTVYGIMLPYAEVFAGGLMILGIWTTLSAILTSLMLLSFVIAFGIFPEGRGIFNKDLILLAVSISLLYSGSGGWSVDRFRKTG